VELITGWSRSVCAGPRSKSRQSRAIQNICRCLWADFHS
jgi:hypothetical protein